MQLVVHRMCTHIHNLCEEYTSLKFGKVLGIAQRKPIISIHMYMCTETSIASESALSRCKPFQWKTIAWKWSIKLPSQHNFCHVSWDMYMYIHVCVCVCACVISTSIGSKCDLLMRANRLETAVQESLHRLAPPYDFLMHMRISANHSSLGCNSLRPIYIYNQSCNVQGCVSATTRSLQLCWGNQKCGIYMYTYITWTHK